MTKRFFVALVTAFILLQILGFQRAQGQSNPDPKLVDGAKKEGQMIFYTTMTLDQSKEVVDQFQKKYPFIKPLFRTGGGPLLNSSNSASRRAEYRLSGEQDAQTNPQLHFRFQRTGRSIDERRDQGRGN